MTAGLSVQGLVKRFGGLTAVDGCSLEIAKGRITGLIGPNGAGKSTLFSLLAGAQRPDAGRVLLDGDDITGLPPHRLHGKGVVRTFQTPQEFARMSVRENLLVAGPGQSGERLLPALLAWRRVRAEEAALRDKVQQVLDFLNLSGVASQPAGAISGGQKKLLELGRTMMAGAKVILLDEPGAGVNRTLLGKLAETILRLNQEQGLTVCLIEHDMDLIARLCDPVIVMAQGSVIAQGDMDSIRTNPTVRTAYLGGTL